MTGSVASPVTFPSSDVAGTEVNLRPPLRATPSYSVDTFAEFLPFAISRTPTTSKLPIQHQQPLPFEMFSSQERDEELFRDLFAADNEWDREESSCTKNKTQYIQTQKTKHPIWCTGASLAVPFLPTKPHSVNHTLSSDLPLAVPVPQENEQPKLSVSVPRLNLADLMTARPNTENSWSRNPGQLLGVHEEEDDEDTNGPESNPNPFLRRHDKKIETHITRSNSNSNNNAIADVQQGSLRLLEKLNLKTLLHTPRPDVLDFYPAGPTSTTGCTTNLHEGDSRIEDDTIHSDVTHTRSININRTVKSSRKDIVKTNTRLAHMESTYGTTKNQPRKTRKETIERLANPILGYSSTLQALSPESRRKRESTVDFGNLSSKSQLKTVEATVLDHVASAANLYHAVLEASSTRAVTKQFHSQYSPRLSNNQLEDQHDTAVKPKVGSRVKTESSSSMYARKAALKKKIINMQAERRKSRSESEQPEQVTVNDRCLTSTFLTQHEDEEAKLESRTGSFSKQQIDPHRPILEQTTKSSTYPRRVYPTGRMERISVSNQSEHNVKLRTDNDDNYRVPLVKKSGRKVEKSSRLHRETPSSSKKTTVMALPRRPSVKRQGDVPERTANTSRRPTLGRAICSTNAKNDVKPASDSKTTTKLKIERTGMVSAMMLMDTAAANKVHLPARYRDRADPTTNAPIKQSSTDTTFSSRAKRVSQMAKPTTRSSHNSKPSRNGPLSPIRLRREKPHTPLKASGSRLS